MCDCLMILTVFTHQFCSRSSDILAVGVERPRVDYVLTFIDMTDKQSYLAAKKLIHTNILTTDYLFGRFGVVVTQRTHCSQQKLYHHNFFLSSPFRPGNGPFFNPIPPIFDISFEVKTLVHVFWDPRVASEARLPICSFFSSLTNAKSSISR